ncbi:MAG: polysaccharide deacetylase family protein [Theionarchaea archaeon]|nr:polysaccharide deacetylase family protein [Theionarchaea archaeon]
MIPFLITVDTEQDVAPHCKSYEGLDYIPLLLALFRKERVQATFFVTGSIAEEHPELFDHLENHEIGCHGFYHELYGRKTPWLADGCELSIKKRKKLLIRATDLLEEAAQEPIKGFRAPYFQVDEATLALLEELQYVYDSSVSTYRYGWPFQIYHPASDDRLAKGNMRLLEIPVSSDPFSEEIGHATLSYSRRHFRLNMAFLRLFGIERCIKSMENIKKFQDFLHIPPFFVFWMHSWELHPDPPWKKNPSIPPYLHWNCHQSLELLEGFIKEIKKRWRINFQTASDALEKRGDP